MDDIVFLTLDDILRLHKKIIKRFGGAGYLVRDKTLLESAIAQPQATVFGKYLYKDIFSMATAYCYHIIKNHPFIDGNKRIGLLVALTFLEKNGCTVIATPESLYELAMGIASSTITKEQAAFFFKKNTNYL